MTTRRHAKRDPHGLWSPWWLVRRHKRYDRCVANGMGSWPYFYWAQPEPMDCRFDHARVLARKPRAGRKRR